MSDARSDGPYAVGIGGSTNPGSATNALLDATMALLEASGARTRLFAGAQLATLPIFAPDATGPHSAALELIEAVRAADAVVVATPGYHGGMSGLVKNALDHLEWLRDDVHPYLDGRAVGVVVAAAGWQACGTALVAVRSAVHALRGWPTPFGVTVNSAEQRVSATDGIDDRVTGALQIMSRQLLDFVSWRRSAGLITVARSTAPAGPDGAAR